MNKANFDHPRRKKGLMSVNKAQQRDFPATHWASAVAMLRAMNTPVKPEPSEPLPEDFSVTDIDVIRARRLSNQI
jgi:hypothetical protein